MLKIEFLFWFWSLLGLIFDVDMLYLSWALRVVVVVALNGVLVEIIKVKCTAFNWKKIWVFIFSLFWFDHNRIVAIWWNFSWNDWLCSFFGSVLLLLFFSLLFFSIASQLLCFISILGVDMLYLSWQAIGNNVSTSCD